MNCKHVQKKMPLLCGGDLTPDDEREALLEHVQECESCASELAEFQESRQVFDRLQQDGLPDHFWDSFQEDLNEELEDLPSPAERTASGSNRTVSPDRTSGSTMRTAVFAAAIFLLGIGLGYFGKPFLPGVQSGQTNTTESVSPVDNTGDPSNEIDPRDSEPVHNEKNTRSVYRRFFRDSEQENQDSLFNNPIERMQRISFRRSISLD